MLFSPTFLLFSSIFLNPFLRLSLSHENNECRWISIGYVLTCYLWAVFLSNEKDVDYQLLTIFVFSLGFTWFHSFCMSYIFTNAHFLGVEDLTYLTFVNTRNLHFRAKTWFFIIFERSAFIWINLPSSAGIGCHQNSRPAQVHRRWSSWWVPFSRCLFPWWRSPFGCGCGCPLLL